MDIGVMKSDWSERNGGLSGKGGISMDEMEKATGDNEEMPQKESSDKGGKWNGMKMQLVEMNQKKKKKKLDERGMLREIIE
ncbi:hypothetical protein WR25_08323 [Diploscapter pachys]|uniref:Uncharacterized protein n=1 Tax=Diploscapter pachys TaxID=2018661 RepID=A0A2A2JTC7_9BILA|nr:hypothetical protein WR25_08323 [Diploscapter pachys]